MKSGLIRRGISLLLALMLMLQALPYFALSADAEAVGGECGTSAAWSYADGVLTISGTGATATYTLDGLEKRPWAPYGEEITQVVVQEGITELGNHAFYGLENLKSVSLPAGLLKIQARALGNCPALETVTVPAGVTTLGLSAFAGSGITKLVFLGSAPATISGTAPCGDLTYDLYVPGGDETWTEAKIAALGGTPTKALYGAFAAGASWEYKAGVLTVGGEGATDAYEVADVAKAEKYPFYAFRSQVTSVIVNEGVTKLDRCVFYGMENLESVTLPKSVTRIETRVFKNCAALQSLTIPATLDFLGLEAFVGSGITELIFLGDAPKSFSSTKSCTGLTYDLHILCDNATWTHDKLEALGGDATLVLDHDWIHGELYDVCSRCGARTGVPVTEITLDKTSATIKLSETLTLTATVLPADATDKSIIWTTSAESVATVDAQGKVTPLSGGEAVITATARDNDAISASCHVTVEEELSGQCGENARWKLENGVLTISGAGETTKFNRNGSTDAVDYPWAGFTDRITAVVVEEGITSLKNYAFYNLKNLTSVKLPASLTEIAYGVFRGTPELTELTIPGNVDNLGSFAFADSGLTRVIFLGKAPTKGTADIFSGDTVELYVPCNDESWNTADIGKYGGNVTKLLNHQWSGNVCTVCGAKANNPVTAIRLDRTSVTLYAGSAQTVTATVTPKDATDTTLEWASADERIATVSANGKITGVSVGQTTVTATAKDGSGVSAVCQVTVQPGLGGSCGANVTWTYAGGVLQISGSGQMDTFSRNTQKDTINYPWASVKDEITTVIVGEGITAIRNYAFYQCGAITSVRLPSTLTEIGYGAFQETRSLRAITIPAGVTKLGSQVFLKSGLRTLTFTGKPPVSYGKNLFDGVTAVVYYPCDAATKSFGAGLTWVKTHAFSQGDMPRKCLRCGIIDGEAVTEITLNEKELTLYVGDSFQLVPTILPENAADPTMEWRSGDETVATVSQEGLVTAMAPGSTSVMAVAKDGGGAAALCKITVAEGAGGNLSEHLTWYLKNGTLTISGEGPMPTLTGKDCPWTDWKDQITSLVLSEGVTALSDGAFAGCKNLASVKLPGTLTAIGDGAFQDAAALKSLDIPDGVVRIGGRAFAGAGLESVTFLGHVPETLGEDVFSGLTLTAYYPCGDAEPQPCEGVAWVKMHDYQPSGDVYKCINCGDIQDSATEPSGGEPQEPASSGGNRLWLSLGVVGVVIVAAIVVFVLLKNRKKGK